MDLPRAEFERRMVHGDHADDKVGDQGDDEAGSAGDSIPFGLEGK